MHYGGSLDFNLPCMVKSIIQGTGFKNKNTTKKEFHQEYYCFLNIIEGDKQNFPDIEKWEGGGEILHNKIYILNN